jgi:hypothetical protein
MALSFSAQKSGKMHVFQRLYLFLATVPVASVCVKEFSIHPACLGVSSYQLELEVISVVCCDVYMRKEASTRFSVVIYTRCLCCQSDRLCGLVVRVPGYRYKGPGSIPGTTSFSK